MRNFAVLIDGGFAKRKLNKANQIVEADDFEKLILKIKSTPPLNEMNLHRVYYYDSTPLVSAHKKPLHGGVIKYGETEIAKNSNNLFDKLSKKPYFALRLGELSFEGWQIRSATLDKAKTEKLEISHDDLKPKIKQKGVDMRIGMDIAALTLKKQVQVIVLVTGDSDFIPAMKFARREGANLFLVTLGHHVKPAMLEHSDLVIEIN